MDETIHDQSLHLRSNGTVAGDIGRLPAFRLPPAF